MRDPNGISKGSAFNLLHFQLLKRHNLELQAQFAQMRPIAITPQLSWYSYANVSRPPGGPGLGQQILYGQPPPALLPPQMLPRGRGYRYPTAGCGCGLPDVSIPSVTGGMFSVPYDMGVMPVHDAGLAQPMPMPIGALISICTC
nr:polyadenylate-binding protein 2-like isoform X2 [Ipomoea batatas]